MTIELTRPPTRNGGGSRPPTSRFLEGSMNDRASNAPPPEFLGPDALQDYERQFQSPDRPVQPTANNSNNSNNNINNDVGNSHNHHHNARDGRRLRRDRPTSAVALLQQQLQEDREQQERQREEYGEGPLQHQQSATLAHKKSTGFFGRVRDALFSRGGTAPSGPSPQSQEEIRRKHSSLQEPLPPRQMPSRSQSDSHVAQLQAFAAAHATNGGGAGAAGGGGDRPSREDVLASYNELMANGFFQSHAIHGAAPPPPPPAVSGGSGSGAGEDGGRGSSDVGGGSGCRKTIEYAGQTWEMVGAPPPPPPQQQEQDAALAAGPLSVRPNANRGIPSVPRIPDHYHASHSHSHSHSHSYAGSGASGGGGSSCCSPSKYMNRGSRWSQQQTHHPQADENNSGDVDAMDVDLVHSAAAATDENAMDVDDDDDGGDIDIDIDAAVARMPAPPVSSRRRQVFGEAL
ncbi:hypothetical protein GGR56DRAFT_358693 [Xylariaceae sp. FL0804]|nr:hypothetical protein GGR56DRAFT_358693 [Xylariaceae sp. FL0804]